MEIRARLRNHGLGGVQAKHHDRHDYLNRRRLLHRGGRMHRVLHAIIKKTGQADPGARSGNGAGATPQAEKGRGYLPKRLKLRVNEAKSAVASPWKRKFLGCSLSWPKASKLRIAPASLKRLEGKTREVLKGARGRSLSHAIAELNPVLRGWAAHFRLTETKRGAGGWRS
ncbi:MAG: hypothetical protein KGJ32_02070 [Xanthomonadaceae bacterium]|nr:hypothetical protein [Xanthomonadaceae bacterium]